MIMMGTTRGQFNSSILEAQNKRQAKLINNSGFGADNISSNNNIQINPKNSYKKLYNQNKNYTVATSSRDVLGLTVGNSNGGGGIGGVGAGKL